MELATMPGAAYLGDGRCQFRVWAPRARRVEVHLVAPRERLLPLNPIARGYHQTIAERVAPGTLYLYRLDGNVERPDPASRFQPEGVHGPSQVVDLHFAWQDGGWHGLPLPDHILYELHVGTFTPEGTFDAAIAHLDHLAALGVTSVELMPVAQFPGGRNWGYDGVYPFAVQNSYGGPAGLQRLVDACHRRGLAVVLDVVYNHLGPQGNYLRDYGPYFTTRYRTVWGEALDFDGPDSDQVRRFFIDNALYWVTEFHVDALRLDAVHAILDHSPRTFLEDLAMAVHEAAERLNRHIHVIAESTANDVRLVRSRELGGYGLDAQWNDDFHHALHTLLTGERAGYYEDFGSLHHLAKAFREGFVYSGEYSPFRRRRHGTSSRAIPAFRFVVCAQNHDQVGNRAGSERLSRLVDFQALKVAAGAVILSPFLPLLFMGEEYGEIAPFPYFVSHSDPALVEAVRRGRREEFTAFQWEGEPPDPQDEATFLQARLDHSLRDQGRHRALLEYYRTLIQLRKTVPALARLCKETLDVQAYEQANILFVRRWSGDDEACLVLSLGDAEVTLALPVPAGRWRKRLDSAEVRWLGGGSAAPDILESDGHATVRVPPTACLVWSQDGGRK
ncbi:MAG: malto-oligosyltrehalose trehalohydrolase [Armatimonadetes bacterium]|nr:malto-oligosyltrehalose trehalohydrolase [Armatimonadota bacterium]